MHNMASAAGTDSRPLDGPFENPWLLESRLQ